MDQNKQPTAQESSNQPVAPVSPIHQPSPAANGQPFITSPISSTQLDQMAKKTPSKWRYLFWVLGATQILGIGTFLLVMVWAMQQSKQGVSGTEFVALFLFITLVPATAIVSLINLISLPIYMAKQKPQGADKAFSIVSLVMSVGVCGFALFNIIQIAMIPARLDDERMKTKYQPVEERQEQSSKAVQSVQPRGRSREEAIALMQNCKVDYLVGTTGDINLKKDANTRGWVENATSSQSGIAILEDSPKTYIFTSAAATADLQAQARQFRQACYNTKKLYIAIDDTIETEYPVGTWTQVKQ